MSRARTGTLVPPGADGIWKARAALASILGVGPSLIGCNSGAHAVFDQMHTAACSGDDDKFFAHVVEDKLIENLRKRGWGKTANSMSTEDLVVGTMGLGAANLESLTRSGALSALENWRKDISQKGKSGDVCGWSFIGAEKIGDVERAEVRSKAGNRKYLYFAKIDEHLKLVDFQALDADAPPIVGVIASDAGESRASVPTAMDGCRRLAEAGIVADCVENDAGAAEEVTFQTPTMIDKSGRPFRGTVVREPTDYAYGFMLGRVTTPTTTFPPPPVFQSRRSRIIVSIFTGTGALTDETKEKIRAVVDGL